MPALAERELFCTTTIEFAPLRRKRDSLKEKTFRKGSTKYQPKQADRTCDLPPFEYLSSSGSSPSTLTRTSFDAGPRALAFPPTIGERKSPSNTVAESST